MGAPNARFVNKGSIRWRGCIPFKLETQPKRGKHVRIQVMLRGSTFAPTMFGIFKQHQDSPILGNRVFRLKIPAGGPRSRKKTVDDPLSRCAQLDGWLLFNKESEAGRDARQTIYRDQGCDLAWVASHAGFTAYADDA